MENGESPQDRNEYFTSWKSPFKMMRRFIDILVGGFSPFEKYLKPPPSIDIGGICWRFLDRRFTESKISNGRESINP